MVYIAAAVTRSGEDASGLVQRMLLNTGGPPSHSIGVASPGQIEYPRSPDFTQHVSPVLLGARNTEPIHYPPYPLSPGTPLVFDGLLYDGDTPDSLTVAEKLQDDPVKGMEALIASEAGAFTVVALDGGSIVCGRDAIGTVPLYWGETGGFRAVASNMKMLWSIGASPQPVVPGMVIRLDGAGVEEHRVKEIEAPEPVTRSMEASVNALDAVMRRSAASFARRFREGAVAFSGGIDSTLAAYYLNEAGCRLALVCVGVEEKGEYEEAQEAADALGLEVAMHPVTEGEVTESVDRILASIEDPNPMRVGVAAPLLFAAEWASSQGYTVIYSGNGSDELFGGYKKYHRLYLEGGDPRSLMHSDLKDSWMNNYDRDAKICRDTGVALALPFAHPGVVHLGLTLPLDQLLPREPDKPRKKVLRALATELGLPEEVANRPKKAAQYSTGVNKTLTRYAKSRGFRLSDYLTSRFKKIKETYTG